MPEPPRIFQDLQGREGHASKEETARPDQVFHRNETVLIDGLTFIFLVTLEFEGQTANKRIAIQEAPEFYTEFQFQQAVTEALNRAWNIQVPSAHGSNEQNSNTEEPPGTPTFGGTDISPRP